MQTATFHFYSKMQARGWKQDQLYMVFALKRTIPQILIKSEINSLTVMLQFC